MRKSIAVHAAALVTLLAGCAGGSTTDHSPADVAFATRMIPHHAQALQIADMTIGKDASPQVERLAERIRAAQQPEIDTMAGWLKEWGAPVPQTGYGTGDAHTHDEGLDPMDGMSGMDGMDGMDGGSGQAGDAMPGMMSARAMARLGEARGPEFTRLWLDMMVRHHEGALAMARAELARGEDEAARDLARRVIDGQQAEIRLMRRLEAHAAVR